MADRPDPENRPFRHADPIAWTVAHRGNILRALYTLMLGNPRLRASDPPPAETRFKMWWHLVGSAVEHAAARHVEYAEALAIDIDRDCRPARVGFKDMFLEGERHEEQTGSLATVLDALRTAWADFWTSSGEQPIIRFDFMGNGSVSDLPICARYSFLTASLLKNTRPSLRLA